MKRIPFTRRAVVKPKKIYLGGPSKKEELFNARPQWPRGPERIEESDTGISSGSWHDFLIYYLIVCGIGAHGFVLLLLVIYSIK